MPDPTNGLTLPLLSQTPTLQLLDLEKRVGLQTTTHPQGLRLTTNHAMILRKMAVLQMADLLQGPT